VKRIDDLFERKRKAGERSLIPFISAGYPSLEFTEQALPRLAEWGCDLIELGIPFSDPVADGPTIQAASSESLAAGTTVKKILAMLPTVREKIQAPIILFSAYNPLLKYGLEKIVRDAKEGGADGFLAADLLPEEGEEFGGICAAEEMALVYLVAPTSSLERKKAVAAKCSGFVYYVSRRGVTGARDQMAGDLKDQVSELRSVTDKPIGVGFGVSRPEHARQVIEAGADGVVVGSALIDAVREGAAAGDPISHLERFVRPLAAAIE
jgi:tryptophan synthase alpha chain